MERREEERGPVDDASEVYGADGVDVAHDERGLGARFGGAWGVCGEGVFLKEGESLVPDVREVVFVREADDGGGLVEGERGVPRGAMEALEKRR